MNASAGQIGAPYPCLARIRRTESPSDASEAGTATHADVSFDAGSNEVDLVGTAGFEPATSRV